MPQRENPYYYKNEYYKKRDPYPHRDPYMYPYSKNGKPPYPYPYSTKGKSTKPYSYPPEEKSAKDVGPMPVKVRRAVLIIGLITMFTNAFLVGAPYWRSTLGWYGAARWTNYWAFEGLFLSCIRQGYQALSQCYNLYPIMGVVDGEVGVRSGKDHNIYPMLTSFRALMIIGMVFSLAGVICSVLGMRCATVIPDDTKQKKWVILAGGGSHLLAGLFTGISVSWYAGEVIYEFYAFTYQTVRMKFTLGACIYVGWISMVISLICGFLMTCWIFCNKSDDEDEYDKNYYPATLRAMSAAAQPLTNTEIIDEDPRRHHNFDKRRHSEPGSALRHGSKPDDYYVDEHTSRKISRVSARSSRPSSRRGSSYSEHYHHHHSNSRRGSHQIDNTDHHIRSSRRGSLFPAHLEEGHHDVSSSQKKIEKTYESSSSITNSGKNVQTESGFV